MGFLASAFPMSPLSGWFSLGMEIDSDDYPRIRDWLKNQDRKTADPFAVAAQLQAQAGF